MQEVGQAAPPSEDWRPVATNVTTPDYTIKELSPRKDYKFRIRQELENGDLSEPTPPIHYYRTQMPMAREPFTLAEYKPVDYTDTTFANRTYVEHLTKFVPPRLPIDKPEMVVINPETVELAWKPARVPDAIRHSSNLTYTIEVRTPPSFDWRELISGLKDLNHTVRKLHSRIDYVFRVRAWNEYGCSEPSLPVSLYRPKKPDGAAELADEEAWERDWELRFGQQVPPKLPMDTPKVLTRSPESIWLSWKPARIPAYATQTPITYAIEVKRPPGTSYHREVSGLVDCQYIMDGLSQSQDYSIQVRAETEFGVSDPTLPVLIQRSKPSSRPGSRRSSLERDIAAEEVNIETMRLDSVTAGAPPRMSSNRPMASNVKPESFTLTWSAARLPAYVKHSQITYIIERRDLPSHVWTVLARDVTDTSYDVRGLQPDTDYMFRVKARNEFGLSEPTLPMSIYRDRDDYVPQKVRGRSGSRDSILSLVGRRGHRGSSVDYTRADTDDVDVCMRDKIPTQPEYATAVTYDTQYGAEGKKGRISLQVRGYPLPTIHWYLNEEKLEYGEGYNAYMTPTGGVTLEIKNICKDTIGQYKCYAQNVSGSAIKMVEFRIADAPTVLEPLRDVVTQSYRDVTLTCRADGTPAPTVKWMKDWRPITESSRVTVSHTEPDTWSIVLSNVLTADSGVYACSIENIAGKVTSAARLNVEDDAPATQDIVLKTSPVEDSYHILEEIRRDKHGVFRHVIEKSTGNDYTAKFISLRNKAQKNFFLSEFEILRALSQTEGVVTLHDAFETERRLVFVTEPLSGQPVTDQILADGDWTEGDVADVVKQLLGVTQSLQSQQIVHLDIKPSNVWLSGPGRREVKLNGFDLARQLLLEEEITQNYGSVGFTSPEQITDGAIFPTTDTWAVGVLAYTLLSGSLPFAGATDVDSLTRTKDCQWTFGEDFETISQEGRDFISKLLVKDPRQRMSVDECISHPWLTNKSETKLNVDKLRELHETEKHEREAGSVTTTANLQSLSKILYGESALYQPAIDQDSGEIIFPDQDQYGDFLDEDAWYEWNLQYLDDPDVQTFPLESKEFRIRESRHTAADDTPEDKETEEQEDSSDGGANIMFRNKIQNETFMVGDDVTFSCTVVSPDSPAVVTWYRDETLLSDAYRAEPSFSEDGVAKLTIQNAKDYDAGVYKCVARNKDKRVFCQARLLLGDLPGKPGRPVITQTSGTEVFLTWTGPVSDGNAYLLGYRVDFKAPGDIHWTRGPYVTEDYAIIGGLVPNTEYIFRVSCHNKYGTSPYSWASISATTQDAEAAPITISSYLEPMLQFSSFSRQEMTLQPESRRPSVTAAEPATIQDGMPQDSYKILNTISSGKFAEYKNCIHIPSNKPRVMKVVPYTTETHAGVTHEFEILKSVRQINIITVIESYVSSEEFSVIFERLSGINVIQYLCLRKTYTEEMVARIVRQVMDALQHLKNYGIAHLNLQPNSVAMATRRRLHVKLRDFTQARVIESGKELPMTPAGYTDFIAPEVIQSEPVGHPADVWSLGVLTFTLLSGVSPFAGRNTQDTLTNILYGRCSTTDLYDNVSKESIKFINKLLKRVASNRPTINRCLESRWLQLSDSMMKARSTHHFRTERLRDFQTEYQQRRADSEYTNVTGVKLDDLPKPTVGPIRKPIIHENIIRRDISLQIRKPRVALKSQTVSNSKQVDTTLKAESVSVKQGNGVASGLATLETMPDFFLQLNQLKSEMDKLFSTTQSLGDSAENVSKAADVVTKDIEILNAKLEEVKEPVHAFETHSTDACYTGDGALNAADSAKHASLYNLDGHGLPDAIEEVIESTIVESEEEIIETLKHDEEDTGVLLTSEGDRKVDLTVTETPTYNDVTSSETDTDVDVCTGRPTEDIASPPAVCEDRDTLDTSVTGSISPESPEIVEQINETNSESAIHKNIITTETKPAEENEYSQIVEQMSEDNEKHIEPEFTSMNEGSIVSENLENTDEFLEPDIQTKNECNILSNNEITGGRLSQEAETINVKSVDHVFDTDTQDDRVFESTDKRVPPVAEQFTEKPNERVNPNEDDIAAGTVTEPQSVSQVASNEILTELEIVDKMEVAQGNVNDVSRGDVETEESTEQSFENSSGTDDLDSISLQEVKPNEQKEHDVSNEVDNNISDDMTNAGLVETSDSTDVCVCEESGTNDIETIVQYISKEKASTLNVELSETAMLREQAVVSPDHIVEESFISEKKPKPEESLMKYLDDKYQFRMNDTKSDSDTGSLNLGVADNFNNENIESEMTKEVVEKRNIHDVSVSEKSEVQMQEKVLIQDLSLEPVEENNIVPELKPKSELTNLHSFSKEEIRRDSSQAYITPEADSEAYFSAEDGVDNAKTSDNDMSKAAKYNAKNLEHDISAAVLESLKRSCETAQDENVSDGAALPVDTTEDIEQKHISKDDTIKLEPKSECPDVTTVNETTQAIPNAEKNKTDESESHDTGSERVISADTDECICIDNTIALENKLAGAKTFGENKETDSQSETIALIPEISSPENISGIECSFDKSGAYDVRILPEETVTQDKIHAEDESVGKTEISTDLTETTETGQLGVETNVLEDVNSHSELTESQTSESTVEEREIKPDEMEIGESINGIESVETEAPPTVPLHKTTHDSTPAVGKSQDNISLTDKEGEENIESEIQPPVTIKAEDAIKTDTTAEEIDQISEERTPNDSAPAEIMNQDACSKEKQMEQTAVETDESEEICVEPVSAHDPKRVESNIKTFSEPETSCDSSDTVHLSNQINDIAMSAKIDEERETVDKNTIEGDLTAINSKQAVPIDETHVESINRAGEVAIYEEKVTHKFSPTREPDEVPADNGVSSEDCGKYLTKTTPEPQDLMEEAEAVADRLVTDAIDEALAEAVVPQ